MNGLDQSTLEERGLSGTKPNASNQETYTTTVSFTLPPWDPAWGAEPPSWHYLEDLNKDAAIKAMGSIGRAAFATLTTMDAYHRGDIRKVCNGRRVMWESNEAIADAQGQSARNVRRHVKVLEHHGYISEPFKLKIGREWKWCRELLRGRKVDPLPKKPRKKLGMQVSEKRDTGVPKNGHQCPKNMTPASENLDANVRPPEPPIRNEHPRLSEPSAPSAQPTLFDGGGGDQNFEKKLRGIGVASQKVINEILGYHRNGLEWETVQRWHKLGKNVVEITIANLRQGWRGQQQHFHENPEAGELSKAKIARTLSDRERAAFKSLGILEAWEKENVC